MATAYREAKKRTRSAGLTLVELVVVLVVVLILAALFFPVPSHYRNPQNARRAQCLSNQKQIGLAFRMYMQDNDEMLPPRGPASGALARWMSAVDPYVRSRDIYRCPSDPAMSRDRRASGKTSGGPQKLSSYSLNAWIQGNGDGKTRPEAIDEPDRVIYLAESAAVAGPGGAVTGDYFHSMCWTREAADTPPCAGAPFAWDAEKKEPTEIDVRRHRGGSNYMYLDGHARWSKWSRVYWQDPARGVFAGDFDPRQ